jgi:hypothetical protein
MSLVQYDLYDGDDTRHYNFRSKKSPLIFFQMLILNIIYSNLFICTPTYNNNTSSIDLSQ